MKKFLKKILEFNSFLFSLGLFSEQDFYNKNFLDIFYKNTLNIFKFVLFGIGASIWSSIVGLFIGGMLLILGIINIEDIKIFSLLKFIIYIVLPIYILVFFIYIKSEKEFNSKKDK